jgi:hypothetical protein
MNDQMPNFITSIQNISKELSKKIFSDVSLDTVSNELQKAIELKTADGSLTPSTWKAEVTDANMFDAATTSRTLDVDESQTGSIFRACAGCVQITLQGIERKNGNQKYVHVTFNDIDGTTNTEEFTSKESPRHFSLNVIRGLVGLKPHVFPRPLSKHHRLMQCSDQMKYAMKRAGDWGQVEHCLKYKKIFVTTDKFAALYAYYRGVRFIFMRQAHHRADPNIPTQAAMVKAYPKLPAFFERHIFIVGYPKP